MYYTAYNIIIYIQVQIVAL